MVQFLSWGERRVNRIRAATERAERQAVHAFGGSVTARHVAALKHMERWPTLVAKLDRLSHPRHLESACRDTSVDVEGLAAVHPTAVDTVVLKIANVLCEMVDRVAAAEPKRSDTLQLVNYTCFLEATRDVGAPLRRVLREVVQQAKEKHRAAKRRFVEKMGAKHFGVLLGFIERMQHLTEKLSAEEVPYQVGCSVSDFRKIVKNTTSLLEKSIVQMAKAVAERLGSGTPVQRDTWEACKSLVLSRYQLLESMARSSYPSDAATMTSSGQVLELFRAV